MRSTRSATSSASRSGRPPNDALFRGAQNPLMPGIIWGRSREAHPRLSDRRARRRNEIKNFSIIRDPMTPLPRRTRVLCAGLSGHW